MEVIPEPEKNSASVLILKTPCYISNTPFAAISGGGNTDYICGGCSAVLASQVNQGMLVSIVLKCLNCGSYNIVRGTGGITDHSMAAQGKRAAPIIRA